MGMVNLALLYAEGKGVEGTKPLPCPCTKGDGTRKHHGNVQLRLDAPERKGRNAQGCRRGRRSRLAGAQSSQRKARQRLIQSLSGWTPEFRRALQTRLRDRGYYA